MPSEGGHGEERTMGLRTIVAVPSRRSVLIFVGLIALTFGLVLSQAPRANALVYWTTLNPAPHYGGSIGVARLDGTGSSNYFIKSDLYADDGTPEHLTVNSGHIYWGNPDGYRGPAGPRRTIGRANPDGSGIDPAFIDLGDNSGPGILSPSDVIATEGYVYWNDLSRDSIGRATAAGGGVDYSFIDSVSPGGIAATDDHIYWRSCTNEIGVASLCYLDAEWIARANSDGSGIDHEFLLADPGSSGGSPGGGLAVSSSHIYWDIPFPDTGGPPVIARAPIDGGAVDETFITLLPGRYGSELAVGNGYIYWADANGCTIGRARLDGSAVDPNFITINVAPCDDFPWGPIDVAVDSRTQLPPLDGPPGGGDDDEACAKAKAVLEQAKAKLKTAKKKLKTAKKKLKKARKTGTDAQAAKAKKKVKKAKKKVKKAKKNVGEARENVKRACG
jgi:hypothetical protein